MRLRFTAKHWLFILLVVGFSLRLGVAVMFGLDAAPADDAVQYDTYAWNLAHGYGYRGMSPDVTDLNHLTAHRAPGTSLLWAALYKVSGHHYSTVRIAHCVLGAITVLLVYAIGKQCFGERIAILSASVFALWPTSLLYSTQLSSEPLFTFLFLWYLCVSLQVGRGPTIARAAAAGILLGFAILTRANAAFMIPLTALWASWQFRGRWKDVGIGLVIPIAATLTLIPWSVRNYAVFREFLPLGTAGGDPFLGSNNRIVAADPVYYGYWVPPESLPEYADQLREVDDELRRYHMEKEFAAQWIKNHPGRWMYLVQAKLRRFLTPVLAADSPRSYRLGMLLSWGPVLILSALSFFPTAIISLRRKDPSWIVHLAICSFGLTAVIFWGASRFRYPVEALFIMLALVSVCWLRDQLPVAIRTFARRVPTAHQSTASAGFEAL